MALSIFRQVQAAYAQKHAQAQERAGERQRAVYAQLPELNNIDAQLAGLYRQVLSQALAGEIKTGDVAGIVNARAEALQAEKKRLLSEAGYDESVFEPHYECALCRDTGSIEKDGRSSRCTCFNRALVQAACESRDFPPLDSDACFEAADFSVFSDKAPGSMAGRKSQRAVMRQLYAFAKDDFAGRFPDTRKRNLILSGGTGLGKTYLCQCIAREVLSKGYSVLPLTAYHLIEILRAYHCGAEDADTMDALKTADLLIIDDLGAEPLYNNVTVEHLFTLISERSLYKRHNIVATNLSVTAFRDRYGERIASRLTDAKISYVFNLLGEDIRLRRG
ncbi:MAG: ATP-binding protein [Christensenellales bacterium]|jgi:DNA replication protein DnaC